MARYEVTPEHREKMRISAANARRIRAIRAAERTIREAQEKLATLRAEQVPELEQNPS